MATKKKESRTKTGHATDWHKIQNPVYECAVCEVRWNTQVNGPLPKRHGE